jgi:hypothetical protein
MSALSMNFHDIVLPVHVVDALGLHIKSPLGMFGVSWCPSSKIDPVVSVHSDNSLHWHSRSEVEWSIDFETRILIKSLGSDISSIINIGHIPFLVDLTIVLSYSNILTFLIFISVLDFDNLFVLDVDKLVITELEDLPPL